MVADLSWLRISFRSIMVADLSMVAFRPFLNFLAPLMVADLLGFLCGCGSLFI